jgi:hypothetical protein
MSYVTEPELVEIVPDLRALASVETSAEVRVALVRLANRYAAMARLPESCTKHYGFGVCGVRSI